MNKTINLSLMGLGLLYCLSCTKKQPTNEPLPQPDPEQVATPIHEQTKIFDGGTGGHHSYRIPSLIRTTNGTLIAFAEARVSNNKDYGNIDVVFKRSTDNGSSWSSLGEVVSDGLGTWGNPTAVVDESNNRVWLFLSWNASDHNQLGTDGFQRIDTWGDRKVYSCYSDNNGESWSTPVDRTSKLLPLTFTWDAVGPGVGIQKSKPGATGRLIIPATSRNIYSDDHGQTWNYQIIPGGTSEGTIVEELNGGLIRNDRPVGSQWELSKRRRISTGSITGFSDFISDDSLLDPACQASTIRFSDNPNRILFLNSASIDTRSKMYIKLSYNEGGTWPVSRRVFDNLTEQQAISQGKGGYSSMTKTADNMVGALIEINENTGSSSTSNRSIEFHKINISWILNGSSGPQ